MRLRWWRGLFNLQSYVINYSPICLWDHLPHGKVPQCNLSLPLPPLPFVVVVMTVSHTLGFSVHTFTVFARGHTLQFRCLYTLDCDAIEVTSFVVAQGSQTALSSGLHGAWEMELLAHTCKAGALQHLCQALSRSYTPGPLIQLFHNIWHSRDLPPHEIQNI